MMLVRGFLSAANTAVNGCRERLEVTSGIRVIRCAVGESSLLSGSEKVGHGSQRRYRPPRRDGAFALLLPVVTLLFIIVSACLLPSQVWSEQRIRMTDQLGRRVDVPLRPRRVVSLAPGITEIVFALGCGDRLVGVTRFSDYPAEAIQLPKVGSYVHPDLERIVALRPDLCIATKDGNPEVLVKRLEALDVPVYAINPRNLDKVVQTVRDLGRLLHADSRARLLADDMHRRINKVRRLVAMARYRPKVFFQIGLAPMVSAGSDTFIDELIRTAGGRNIAAGPIVYPRFSREQVLAAAPDVIIITSMAREAVFQRVKAQWMRWPSLPAVRNRRIHIVDSNLFDRPAPRLVKGLELLAELLHPELFQE